MRPNIENDQFFLNLLEQEVLTVTVTGTVTNLKTGKTLGSTNGGYQRVGVKDHANNKIRLIQTHRLVWLKYKGPIPEALTINHKDGNKLNNNLTNLELVTYSENCLHAYKVGLAKITSQTKLLRSIRVLGQKNPCARFTDEQVVGYRKQAQQGKINLNEIAVKHNTSLKSVRAMLNRTTYTHL